MRRLVAIAGQFRGPATIDDILEKVGAISLLTTIRYWSISGQRWQALLSNAHAVTSADGRQPRGDFSAAEMRSGASLFVSLDENGPLSPAIYRVDIKERTAEHLVLGIENVTALRLVVPLFHPGELKLICIVDRRPDGAWSLHALLRVDDGVSILLQGDGGSYVNRAIAYYRHVAGIATDQEPPTVR